MPILQMRRLRLCTEDSAAWLSSQGRWQHSSPDLLGSDTPLSCSSLPSACQLRARATGHLGPSAASGGIFNFHEARWREAEGEHWCEATSRQAPWAQPAPPSHVQHQPLLLQNLLEATEPLCLGPGSSAHASGRRCDGNKDSDPPLAEDSEGDLPTGGRGWPRSGMESGHCGVCPAQTVPRMLQELPTGLCRSHQPQRARFSCSQLP